MSRMICIDQRSDLCTCVFNLFSTNCWGNSREKGQSLKMVLGQLDMSVKDNGLECFLHTTHLWSTHCGGIRIPRRAPSDPDFCRPSCSFWFRWFHAAFWESAFLARSRVLLLLVWAANFENRCHTEKSTCNDHRPTWKGWVETQEGAGLSLGHTRTSQTVSRKS